MCPLVICMCAAMTTFYVSLNKLPLADGVTLFFLNPAITAVAAWLIMKEALGWNVCGLRRTAGLGKGRSSLALRHIAEPAFMATCRPPLQPHAMALR